jgi:MFS family permease
MDGGLFSVCAPGLPHPRQSAEPLPRPALPAATMKGAAISGAVENGESSHPQPGRTEWRIVAFAVAAGIVGAFQIGKAAMALPALRADLGLGLAAAGWVLAIFNLIGAVAGMALGTIIGRWGDRRTLLWGLAIIGASGLVGAAAPGIALLLATRTVEGVGFLMLAIGAPTLIARVTSPADTKLAFGAWGAYMPTGQALMIVAAPLLLAPFGWRALWVVNAVLVAGFALAMARATRALEPTTAPATNFFRDLGAMATAPGPLLLAAIFACYSGQYLAVMGFLPTILVEREGLSTFHAGFLGAIAIAVNGVGNVGAGILLRKGVPRWRLIAAATIVMFLSSLGIFLLPLPLWASFLLYLSFAIFGGMLPASVFGAVPMLAPAPHLVPATNGLVVQGSNLGQVIGPPAIGALAAAWGWQWSPLLLAPAAAGGLFLALRLRRRERGAAC